MLQFPVTQKNNPHMRGLSAGYKKIFGERSRYCIRAVHDYDSVLWVVTDAETPDENDRPSVIRKTHDFYEAVKGLDRNVG